MDGAMTFTEKNWQQVVELFSKELQTNRRDPWLGQLSFGGVKEGTLQVYVPSPMAKKWIERFYLGRLKKICQDVSGKDWGICVQVKSEREPLGESKPKAQRLPTISLNPFYTFENFVVGKNNHYCYAMAKAVAEKPGSLYNPLFIHGAVGLGKTHLLQAICHQLLKERKDLSILYLSSDTFIEQLIDAIQQGGLSRFRYKYRYVDVLVIDDIHYLANKEQTQEEFFHIFNHLYTSQKQIILSSDSPPKEIPSLQDRLVSRFRWGVVAQLEPPSYETRIAIVRKKAELKNIALPNDVVEFIAQSFSQNIRELEGAVWKLESYAALMGDTINLKMAKQVLADLIRTSKSKISMSDILEEVIKTFNVRLSDLQSKRRSQSIALPRQICMYLAREFTNLSLDEIGEYFGGRDHSTVAHGIEKIAQLTEEQNPKLYSQLQGIIQRLKKKQEAS